MAAFPGGTPRRGELDRLVPDRPVCLESRDGHSAWVNTRALELAGVTAATADPSDGRIERDPDGTPDGHPARGRHRSRRPVHARRHPGRPRGRAPAGPGTPARARRSRRGRTRSSRPTARSGPTRRSPSRGELTARVVGALWWEHQRGADQIDEFVERRRSTAIGRYAPTSVKLMQDGVLENFTGAMLEPYLDGDGGTTDNRGMLQLDPEGLMDWVPRLDALGFQVHFHAIGDRAVREALDAVEAARRANGPIRHATPHRPHPGHPPRRHRALPRPRRHGQRPAVLGEPRGPDGGADDPVPRRSRALAVPVPLAACRRCDARDGLRLERLDRRPAARDGTRGRASSPPSRTSSARCSCRTSGSS